MSTTTGSGTKARPTDATRLQQSNFRPIILGLKQIPSTKIGLQRGLCVIALAFVVSFCAEVVGS